MPSKGEFEANENATNLEGVLKLVIFL